MRMRKLFCSVTPMIIRFLFFLLLVPACAMAQDKKQVKKPTNQMDGAGRKHGLWVYNEPARMGEPGTIESGSYEHGKRTGLWYVINDQGDLISSEAYAFDVLDGEVKYYDRGQLYCRGHYRGLSPRQDFDTIIVVDPITHDESYKVIATERGTMRHGTWRYYDPVSGALLKEEEYQVDELMFKKEYAVSQTVDSLYSRLRNKNLPHRKSARYAPPAGKQFHYTDVLISD
jgi:hypothetical protein